jgi:uncharacterized damage-inducible protein DinB
MASSGLPEYWLRGPVPGIIPSLQPVAHALLQAREEVTLLLNHFPDHHLWERPAGGASVGFHLQHLTGVLDRLFSYAKGLALTPQQLAALASEGKEDNHKSKELVQVFNEEVDKALAQLHTFTETDLTQWRGVGRAQLPSTTLGLLVHAAEHTMRHVGQLLVTVKILTWKNE